MRNYLPIVLSLCLLLPGMVHAFDTDRLARVPVLHEGRVKPMDTFARVHLQRFYGDDRIDGKSAIAWLRDMMFKPNETLNAMRLRITSKPVLSLLGLEEKKPPLYPYHVVAKKLEQHQDALQRIFSKEASKWNATEKSLWELYENVSDMVQIIGTFSLIMPLDLVLPEEELKELSVSADLPFNYLTVTRATQKLEKRVQGIVATKGGDVAQYTDDEQKLVLLAFALRTMEESGRDNRLLRLIPSPWSQNGEWFSPWALLDSGQGAPQTSNVLKQWQSLLVAYHGHDEQDWNAALQQVYDETYALSGVSESLVALEVRYNQLNLIPKAAALYGASLLIAVVAFIRNMPVAARAAFYGMSAGLVLNGLIIVMRMLILGRPPVSTLYESILFVALTAAAYGWWVARRRRLSEGVMIGCGLGALLLAVSGVYAAQGDSMGILIAVLNTKFWLATHVVCITIGYSCSLIAGTMAHVALLTRARDVSRLLIGALVVALLFMIVGTILGGVWADQSWGRFWGWDPKENGALLIVLWLVWILHGRMTDYISATGFTALLAITNIVVALSWFGVNLLNVGLHSYGFTDAAAIGFTVFCGVEIVLIAMLYLRCRLQGEVS